MRESILDTASTVLAWSNIVIATWVAFILWQLSPGYSVWAASMGLCYLINHWTITSYERGSR